MSKTLLSVIFLCILQTHIFADHWCGNEYAQNSSVQLSHAARLLNGLALKGDESILDMGCGDGKISILLATKVPRGFVIGMDPSDSMLDKAEATRKDSGLLNLSFKKGSAENFTLDMQFDHIITIHVMHWIKEQEEALKNLHDHLKPQGQVHFIFAPSKEGLPFHTALQKTLQSWSEDFKGFVNPQQVFDMESYRQFMVKAGFHIEAIQYLRHELMHANKEKLKGWIKQWQPYFKHLDGSKQTKFLNELVDNYLLEIGMPLDTSEPVFWEEYILIVEGTKK